VTAWGLDQAQLYQQLARRKSQAAPDRVDTTATASATLSWRPTSLSPAKDKRVMAAFYACSHEASIDTPLGTFVMSAFLGTRHSLYIIHRARYRTRPRRRSPRCSCRPQATARARRPHVRLRGVDGAVILPHGEASLCKKHATDNVPGRDLGKLSRGWNSLQVPGAPFKGVTDQFGAYTPTTYGYR